MTARHGRGVAGLSSDSRPRYPAPELMDEAGNEALRDAIRHMHGCESTFVESVPVHETFDGQTVWEGDVEVFDLVGHPQARRCYAWSSSTDTPGRRRFHAVLGVGPITDAVMAVRASIVADARRSSR